MTELHWAGQRKENVELSNGPQSPPSRPQPALAAQYVEVQPMYESAGVKNDCVREKNAKPMMYPTTRMANSQGEVKGRVNRMRPGSNPTLCERCPVCNVRFKKGEGSR